MEVQCIPFFPVHLRDIVYLEDLPNIKEDESQGLSGDPPSRPMSNVDPTLAMNIDVPILFPESISSNSSILSPRAAGSYSNPFSQNPSTTQKTTSNLSRSVNLQKFSKLYFLEKYILSFRDLPSVEEHRIEGTDVSYIVEVISQNRDMEELFALSDHIKNTS